MCSHVMLPSKRISFDNVEMEKINPAQVNAITNSLTPDEQKLLHSIVEQAKTNLAKQEVQAPELHLNGN